MAEFVIVRDLKCVPIMGLETSLELGLIKSTDCSTKPEVKTLIKQNSDIFTSFPG